MKFSEALPPSFAKATEGSPRLHPRSKLQGIRRRRIKKSRKSRKSNEAKAQVTDPAAEMVELRLYIAGQTPRSAAAFANLKKLCEEHLPGRYKIEVIDLLQHPQLAAGDQIVAVPTLVKMLPEPLRRVVGDLSHTERALVGLQLRPATQKGPTP